MALPGACNGTSSAGDGGAGTDAAISDDLSEPLICTEFTEAGAPCPLASPVVCFAECVTGGCSCSATPQGPRWVCQTDLSCLPDCAPIDDGCSPLPVGDDGGGDANGDDGGADGSGEAGGGDGAGDGGEAGDAGDASG
jgi:hypothetical protein